MKCCQCQNKAMFDIGSEFPLCLDCHAKLLQAQAAADKARADLLKTLQQGTDYMYQSMDYYANLGPAPKMPDMWESNKSVFHHTNISGDKIGMINTGEMKAESINSVIDSIIIKAEKIDLAIDTLNHNYYNEMADALKKMKEAVINFEEKALNNNIKRQILDHLEYIANESVKPPTNRNIEIIKDAVSKITVSVTTISNLIVIWDFCSKTFGSFFGFTF